MILLIEEIIVRKFFLMCLLVLWSFSIFSEDEYIYESIHKENTIEVEGYIIRNGDLEAESTCGETPVLYAFKYGALECAELLLNTNVNIYAKDEFGISVLEYACSNGNLKLFKKLISKGIDLENKENFQKALNASCENNDVEIFKELMKEKLEISKELINKIVLYDNLNILKEIKFEMIPKSLDNKNDNLFLLATRYSSLKIMEYLIEKNYGLYEVNTDKEDALLIALKQKNHYTIGILSKLDYDVEHKNIDGKTALEYEIEKYMNIERKK